METSSIYEGQNPPPFNSMIEAAKGAAYSSLPAEFPGVIAAVGALPLGALITEEGLANIFGKCTASIKNAVERGELPRPVRVMGKNTWTARSIVAHHEARLEAEARKFARLRA